MTNNGKKPEENDTPAEQVPAASDHISRADFHHFRKEVLQSFQRIADSIESNRHEVGVTLEGIKAEISDGNTKQAVIETRLTMIERIVYGLCAVVGVLVTGGVVALILKAPHS